MGLEAGHTPLTDKEVEARLNCYGPAGTGRLLATIETKDAKILSLQAAARPGSPLPCGHAQHFGWSPDGEGKKIICLLCNKDRLEEKANRNEDLEERLRKAEDETDTFVSQMAAVYDWVSAEVTDCQCREGVVSCARCSEHPCTLTKMFASIPDRAKLVSAVVDAAIEEEDAENHWRAELDRYVRVLSRGSKATQVEADRLHANYEFACERKRLAEFERTKAVLTLGGFIGVKLF
jgi:hypothetical protein